MLLELLLVVGLQTPNFMAVFFLIGSLTPGYFAIVLLRSILFTYKMQRVGVQVAGVIISQRKVQRGRLIPTVRYQTLGGKVIEVESLGSSNVEFYDEQEAYLLYDADEPTDFLFIQEINKIRVFKDIALLLIITLLSISGMWVALELLFT